MIRKKSINTKENMEKKQSKILMIMFIIINIFYLRRTKISLFIIFIIFILGIIKFYYNSYRVSKISKIFLLFWVYYILITLIQFYFNKNNLDFGIFKEFIFKLIIIIPLYLFISNSRKDYYFLLLRNLGLVLCIIGILELITKQSVFYKIILVDAKNWQMNVFGTSQFRIYTIFLHPIVYGMFLVILYWILKNYPIKNYYIHKIFIVLLIVNLLGTKSRSALISFIITITIDLLVRKDRFKKYNKNLINTKNFIRKYIFLCIILILIIFLKDELINVVHAIVDRFYIVFNSESLDGSRTQRMGAIGNAIKFIVKDPLGALIGRGIGYSKIFIMNNPVNVGFNIIDNQYVTLMLECGIIGIYMFMLILKDVFFNIKKYYVSSENKICVMGIITIYLCIFFYEGLDFYSTLYLLTIFIFMLDSNMIDKSSI